MHQVRGRFDKRNRCACVKLIDISRKRFVAGETAVTQICLEVIKRLQFVGSVTKVLKLNHIALFDGLSVFFRVSDCALFGETHITDAHNFPARAYHQHRDNRRYSVNGVVKQFLFHVVRAEEAEIQNVRYGILIEFISLFRRLFYLHLRTRFLQSD